MKTQEEILEKINELWPKSYTSIKRDIKIYSDHIDITLSSMYKPPGLTFKQLLELSKFFETDKIDDANHFDNPGCETCDYGSSYGFTLRIYLN